MSSKSLREEHVVQLPWQQIIPTRFHMAHMISHYMSVLTPGDRPKVQGNRPVYPLGRVVRLFRNTPMLEGAAIDNRLRDIMDAQQTLPNKNPSQRSSPRRIEIP